MRRVDWEAVGFLALCSAVTVAMWGAIVTTAVRLLG